MSGWLRGIRKAADGRRSVGLEKAWPGRIDIKDNPDDIIKQIAADLAPTTTRPGRQDAWPTPSSKCGQADGVITVEEGKSIDTTVDVVEGMQFDRGYLSRTS